MSSPHKLPSDQSVTDEESQNEDCVTWLNDIAQIRRNSIQAKHGIDPEGKGPDFKAQVDSRTIIHDYENIFRRKSSIDTCRFVPGPRFRSEESSMSSRSNSERQSSSRFPMLSANVVDQGEPEYVFAEPVDHHCCSGTKSRMLCLSMFIIAALTGMLTWLMTGYFDANQAVEQNFANFSDVSNVTDHFENSEMIPTLWPSQLGHDAAGATSSPIPSLFRGDTSSPTSLKIDTPISSPVVVPSAMTQSPETLRPTQVQTNLSTSSPTKTSSVIFPSSKPSCAPRPENVFSDGKGGGSGGGSKNGGSDGGGSKNGGGGGGGSGGGGGMNNNGGRGNI